MSPREAWPNLNEDDDFLFVMVVERRWASALCV